MINTTRRYLPAFAAILLTVMLLVQAGLLFHSTQHAVIGGGEHCASCWVADHQHHYVSHATSLALAEYHTVIETIFHSASYQQAFPYYISRAPPVV